MKIKSVVMAALVVFLVSGCGDENDIGAPPKLITTDSNGCQIWYYNPVHTNSFNYVVCPFMVTPTRTSSSYRAGKVTYYYNVDTTGIQN